MEDFFELNPQIRNLTENILKNDTLIDMFKNYFPNNKHTIDSMIKILLDKKTGSLDLVFELFKHTELFTNFTKILLNIRNSTYMEINLASYLKEISDINSTYLTGIIKSFMYITKDLHNKEGDLLNIVIETFQDFISTYFETLNFGFKNISDKCSQLFIDTLFRRDSTLNPILLIFLKKFLFESPRKKEIFLILIIVWIIL